MTSLIYKQHNYKKSAHHKNNLLAHRVKTPENTHKSGQFQGLIAYILERQSWYLRIVRTKMVFVWNCKVRMLLVFFDNT